MTPFDSAQPSESPDPTQELPPELPQEAGPDETVDIEEVKAILSKYWCAPGKTEQEYFEKVLGKEKEYFEFLSQTGYLNMCRVAYATYYGFNGYNGEFESQSLRFAGEDNERVDYVVNEFRSFADQIFNMTVKNRPAFQAQATNTDTRTLGQIEASDNVIKYYYEQVFGERKEKEVVKCEGLYGKGYTVMDWDEDGGPDIEVEEPYNDPILGSKPIKKKVKAGIFDIRRKYPWDVVSDPYRSEHDNHLFRIVLDTVNLYDMVAKYPLYAKAIESQVDAAHCDFASMFPGSVPNTGKDSDKVLRRTVYHAKCNVLPDGRKSVFIGTKMVDDGELPIDVIPVFDLMSCELDGSCMGISDLWNMIPDQQMVTQVMSDAATNIEAFGRPPIAMQRNTDLDIDAMANGMKIAFVDDMTQMPQVVQFPQINEVSMKIVDMCRKFMQAKSGLNAISRGESDASVKSGTHAALYHSMAVENQSPRAGSLDLHRERTTNAILMYLKKYAKHPQLVAIAGVDERPYLQEMTQKDLEGVQRVVIKTANPLLKTQSGRLTVAELLRDWPGQPLRDPAQIIELLTSGQFKPMYSSERSQQLRVRRENELLSAGPPVQEVPSGEIDPMTGQPAVDPTTGQPKTKKTVPTVPVLATDNASKHINSHLEVLSSPDTLNNPAKMEATLAHILEHVAMSRDGDPYLAQLLDLPPPQQAMQPPNDPNASSSGKGPSDKDMSQVQNVTAEPNKKTSGDELDDSQSFGKLPKPAQSPVQP